jgi:chorismate mutase
MVHIKLSTITEHLEGFEETIVFKLIDRAQYKMNSVVYEHGKSGFKGAGDKSLFELRLRSQERMDAQFGRYCVPEERAFTGRLPRPHRKVDLPDTGLRCDNINAINLTRELLAAYQDLLPRLCAGGTDGHFGSSVEHDVYALQAISRRVHYGALYVAECKYRSSPDGYRAMIDAGDIDALLSLLTRKDVEDAIVARVREKVADAQARINRRVRCVIDPDVVVRFYRDYIIPLTKKGEVAYLMNRKK